jgi:hypothetical protein
MRRVYILLLVTVSLACKLSAQGSMDTSKTKGSRGGIFVYFSLAASFDPGRLTVPETNWEAVVSQPPYNGQYSYYNRQSITGHAGTGYGAGVEYTGASRSNFFVVADVGISEYSYTAVVTDALYNADMYTPATTTFEGDVANTASFSFTMADIGLYCFYIFRKTTKSKLSAGLGGRLGHIFSESDQGYQTNGFYYPITVPFLSTELRYEATTLSMAFYFNYGLMGSSNGLASAGFQFGFKV